MIELGADERAVDMNGVRYRESRRKSLTITYLQHEQQQQQQHLFGAGSLPIVITIAICGSDKLRKNPRYSVSEAIILGSTINQAIPHPERGISGNDQLRPERFQWSQRRPDLDENNSSREPGELPIIWVSSTDKEMKQQLCVRIGKYEWFQSRKQEKIDVVVFAHAVDDPLSIAKLWQQSIPQIKTAVPGATMVMLGVGNEARGDMNLLGELSRNRMRILSAKSMQSNCKKMWNECFN